MASLVNPSNINGNFPIAGQDNDSQGFRDNFTNIRNNFTFIKAEVEDLQAKAVLKSALIGTTLNNDFQGSKVKNLQVSNLTETVKDIGAIDTTELTLDLSEGTIVKLLAPNSGDLAIADVIKNWPASLQHARLLLYITVPSTTFTLTLPASWSTDLSAVPGLRRVEDKPRISYTDPGDYVYEITSPDSGTTVFFRELTTGNAVFRDPNFYMVGIGIGSADDVPQRTGFDSPTLMIGLGRYLGGATTNQGIGYKIDSLKSGNDTLVIKGSVTSYQSQVDDTANVSAGVNSLTSGGFSVVKDRTTITSGSLVTEGNIAAGDLVGYFNAIGLTKNSASTNLAYQQLGTIQFVAEGTTTSPFGVGGQILIKTKGDGTADDAMPNEVIGAYNYKATKGALRTAVTIDAKQNVTVHGNLVVMGETTVVESNTVTVEDKNIVLGNGGTETTNQGAGISVASDAADGGANLVLSSASWITNRAFIIANTSPANALVINGNARVGGNLFVGGNLHVANVIYQNIEITTSTETVEGTLTANGTTAATSTSTGALVVKGGAGIANGLYVNGTTFLQNVSSGNVLLTGGSAYNLTHLAATGGAVLTFNAANFTSANMWITGGAIGVSAVTGQVIPASNVYAITSYFNNFSSPNVVITGGSISGVSLPIISKLFVTDFSTGNAVITGGYIQTVANLYATGVVNSGSVQTANVRATFGEFSGPLRISGSMNTGNAVITGGYIQTVANLYATGVVNSGSVQTANVNATFGEFSGPLRISGSMNTGNAVITGGYIQTVANLYATGVVNAGSVQTANVNATFGEFSGPLRISGSMNTGNAVITGGYIQTVANLYATGVVNAGSVFSANVTTANASAFTNDATAATTAFVRRDGGFSTQVVFSTATAGTTTWTIPAGVVKVKATVIGGGGGGGGVTAVAGAAAAGGGGGSVGVYYFTSLTPGGTITYGVGAPGTAGTTAGAAGGAGGVSNVSVGGVTVSAPGGTGGAGATAGSVATVPGTGGGVATQSGGTATAFVGLNGTSGMFGIGAAASTAAAGGVGAAGFMGTGGGSGKVNVTGAGTAGSSPGAGGGGALGATASAGGAGGAGAVIFEY